MEERIADLRKYIKYLLSSILELNISLSQKDEYYIRLKTMDDSLNSDNIDGIIEKSDIISEELNQLGNDYGYIDNKYDSDKSYQGDHKINKMTINQLSKHLSKLIKEGKGDMNIFIGEYYLLNDNVKVPYKKDNKWKYNKLDVPYVIDEKDNSIAICSVHYQEFEENLKF